MMRAHTGTVAARGRRTGASATSGAIRRTVRTCLAAAIGVAAAGSSPTTQPAAPVAAATAGDGYGIRRIISATSSSPGRPAPPAAPGTHLGRVTRLSEQTSPRSRLFPPQDLGLLEGPDRDQWQKPDLIMDALGIADGAVVADLGAGGGWFTIRLARRVGPNGTVYAEDIQPQMIEAIGRRVAREGLSNVRTVLGTARDPRLPAGLDAVLIVDAYHEMEDPITLLANVARSLKPQGRVGVVDFLPGSGGPGPAPEERPDPDAVIAAAGQAGLHLQAREAVPPFQFLLVFGRVQDAGTIAEAEQP